MRTNNFRMTRLSSNCKGYSQKLEKKIKLDQGKNKVDPKQRNVNSQMSFGKERIPFVASSQINETISARQNDDVYTHYGEQLHEQQRERKERYDRVLTFCHLCTLQFSLVVRGKHAY